jgi:hypothetical protein
VAEVEEGAEAEELGVVEEEEEEGEELHPRWSQLALLQWDLSLQAIQGSPDHQLFAVRNRALVEVLVDLGRSRQIMGLLLCLETGTISRPMMNKRYIRRKSRVSPSWIWRT